MEERIKSPRKDKDASREERKAYNRQWARNNKALRNLSVEKDNAKEKMETIKEAEIFIKKIEQQGGWCDEIDGFHLTGLYSELFGAAFQRKYPDDMESELSFMYLTIKRNIDKIKSRVQKIGEFHTTKECSTCKKVKPITDYTTDNKQKDGKSINCRPCKSEYQKRYLMNNPDKADIYRVKNNKRKR